MSLIAEKGKSRDHTNDILYQADVVKDLQKARLECENLKRQMLQQEINFNIQKTEALTRSAFLCEWQLSFLAQIFVSTQSFSCFSRKLTAFCLQYDRKFYDDGCFSSPQLILVDSNLIPRYDYLRVRGGQHTTNGRQTNILSPK